jgi:hypothetical protein
VVVVDDVRDIIRPELRQLAGWLLAYLGVRERIEGAS